VLPFWYDTIVPAMMSGQRVVVVAHGNSIRALMKHLENISEADIVELNIPNAVPVIYELDASMRPIGRQFLEPLPS
jgi:2,3-bisphosphoglycerate-dependent phosphoglycerate mutase